MSKPTIANSPVRPGDRSLTVPGRPGVVGDQDLASPTSLEAERCGLLAAPGGRLEPDQPRSSRLEPDRRMAEWIASNLDLASAPAPETRSAWNRLVEGLPGLKRKRISQRWEPAPPTTHDVWARFHVAYRRGITVVRIADKSLVKEPQIRELACDLFDLIAAGNHRIVLNFRATQRLASWVVVVAGEARRRCAAGDGGALKICGLAPELASIFPIAGMTQGIELYDDEAAALDSPWPEAAGPRALPVEILTALTRAADLPPIRGGAPAGAAREAHKPVGPKPAPNFDDLMADRVAAPETEVWLLVQIGGVKGRAVRIHGPNFVIGRDATCQLRLGSAMVSKLHAAILSRDDGIFVRDLGSTNGTIINGQAIRKGDLEVKSGDRIQIGPVVATLAVGRSHGEVAQVEELVAGWLQTEGTVSRPYHGAEQPTLAFPSTEPPDNAAECRLKHEVLQDVLVITPQVSELDDFEAVEDLRSHLHLFYEQPMPRHVVVNFECVRHLSARLIGVLLAHHLRLDRTGGALRICQAHARVMAVLHQVRLTMLVECYPTLDEAVLAAWPTAPYRAASAD